MVTLCSEGLKWRVHGRPVCRGWVCPSHVLRRGFWWSVGGWTGWPQRSLQSGNSVIRVNSSPPNCCWRELEFWGTLGHPTSALKPRRPFLMVSIPSALWQSASITPLNSTLVLYSFSDINSKSNTSLWSGCKEGVLPTQASWLWVFGSRGDGST